MTEYEKMIQGKIYDPSDKEIMDEQAAFLDKLWELNQLKPSDYEKKIKYMKEVFAECGDGCYIELPFRSNWGGHHVHFGNGIYANYNLTIVDDGNVFVGDKVMFGPNVTIATAGHPIEPSLRSRQLQYNRDVHIGRNSVIGAGSIVTKDIPDNVVAVGNPCHVLRKICDHDRKFFYKEDQIDWSNI